MSKSVFISYSHSDKEVAFKLKEFLESKNVKVVIDTDSLRVGDDIKKFIESSISKTELTLAMVSTRSLKSGWVAMETANTFFLERMQNKSRFIACYLDSDFFERNYTDKLNSGINTDLQEIRDLIKNRMDDPTMPGIQDLQNELLRYQNLKNNLDQIIARLRASFCVNLCNKDYNEAFSIIFNALKDDVTPNKTTQMTAFLNHSNSMTDRNGKNGCSAEDYNVARSAISKLQPNGIHHNTPIIRAQIEESLGDRIAQVFYNIYFLNEFGTKERLNCTILFETCLSNTKNHEDICKMALEIVENAIERQEEMHNVNSAKGILDHLKIPPYRKFNLYRKMLLRSNGKFNNKYFWDDLQQKCLSIAPESLFEEVVADVMSTWKHSSFNNAMNLLRTYDYRSVLPELRDEFNEMNPDNVHEALNILRLLVEWDDLDASECIFRKIEMTTTPKVASQAIIALRTLGQKDYIEKLNVFLPFAPKPVADAIRPIMQQWT